MIKSFAVLLINMAEMEISHRNVLLDLISDFEEFITKIERRKEELQLLKDDLLIYSDPEFMESIKKGINEAQSGKTVKCKNIQDRKKLFESL